MGKYSMDISHNPKMKNTNINSAFLGYIGFFRYNAKLLKQKKWKEAYVPATFFSQSQSYLEQKYYMNWLHSMFQCFQQQPNHLELIPAEVNKLNASMADDKNQNYTIEKLEVLLFPKGFGLFVIKTNIRQDHLQWEYIANTANATRQVVLQKDTPLAVQWVEQYVTPYFCKEIKDWRKYNAQLKTITLIDIDQQPTKTNMDSYLFAMGNHISPQNRGNLYMSSGEYSAKMIEEASIFVFHNWKALCLYDSLTRIAVNLDEKDHFKLWQNEYLYLYVNVLLNRFFLQHTNDKLVDFTKNFKTLLKSRDLFFVLISKYNHYKLSYKFSPNLLYSKFSTAMDIQNEIDAVENKIERLNALSQEKNDKRTQNILAVLTVLSTFFALTEIGKSTFELSERNFYLFLGIVLLIIVIITFFLLSGRKSNNL